MKAAVLYEANQPLAIEELDLDEPGFGEVRIRMGSAGICASDHHIMTGSAAFPMPIVLGHEGAGTVEEVGPGVSRVKPGDRCVISFISPCGHCTPCNTGQPQLCDTHRQVNSLMFDGTARLHKDGKDIFQMQKVGVFGEHAVIPEAACSLMPDDVPMEVAALIGCSVTTGVGGVINQPNIQTGGTVVVIGLGGVGLNALQGAKLLNSRQIIAVDIHDHKLEFAYRFGATHVVNSRSEDAVAKIMELTGGEGADFAFDTFGASVTTGQAIDSVKKGGTAVIIGLAPTGETVPLNLVDLVRLQKNVVGSYYGSASPHETFNKLITFYQQGKLDIDGLITRRYELEQINEAFDALERGEDGRGVIVFD
jgi:NDMA-dependent alcohol dehydrogenase